MKHSILTKARFLSLVLTIIMVLGIVAVPVSAGTKLTINVKITYDQVEARKMLSSINNMRKNDAWLWKSSTGDEKENISGLSQLTYDYSLEKIAIQRAEELAQRFETGIRPDGSGFNTIKIDKVTSEGECICSGCSSVTSAFYYWEESNEPNHYQANRAMLLDSDFKAVGIAHVKYGDTDFWTLEFGSANSGTPKTTAKTGTSTKSITLDSDKDNYRLAVKIGEENKISMRVGDEIDMPKIYVKVVYGGESEIPISASDCSFTYEFESEYIDVSNGKIKALAKTPTTFLTIKGTYQGMSFSNAAIVVVMGASSSSGSGSSGSSGSGSSGSSGSGTTTPSGGSSSGSGSSSGGSSSGSGSSQNPAAPTVVVTQDDPTADAITNFVRRVYRSVLGREGEDEGVNYWINALYNYQVSGADLAMQFVTSKEYTDKGTSNDQFVEMLYSAFFGRASDTDGKNYWLSQLSGGVSREEVAKGFVNSKEWANTCAEYGIRSGGTQKPTVNIDPTADTYAFVERMYTKAFKRASDNGGLEYWSGLLANYTTTGEAVAMEFFMSPEMESYNLSDEEFLERLYLTFMDRESEPDGRAFWLNEMKTMSRREVVQCFAKSEEFRLKCIKARILPC